MADPRRASTGQAPRMVMGPPETPNRVMQPSPNLFPTLQFSPDMFSTAAFGPQTAPAYPQQRLFWDPNMAGMESTSSLQPYQDPFALSQAAFNDSFTSTTTIVPPFDLGQHPAEQQPYDLPAITRPMSTSYIDGAAFPAPFSTSPRPLPPRDDNPSMFLSSPARRFDNTTTTQPLRMPVTAIRDRPAYHHQIEDSRREREAKRLKKLEGRHPSVTRSVMEALRRPVSPIKDTRPSLRRSLTHSGVGARQPHLRNQSHVSFLDNISNASGSTNRSGRNGRSSPLKSLTHGIDRQQAGSRNSKRTSLALSIDENGVAKTVVTKVEDDADMDLDDESSESEASSRDESDFHILRSQQNSFAFEDDDETHNPSHLPSRLQGHSKSSSYSAMTSNSSALHSSRASSAYSAANSRGPNRALGQRKAAVLDPIEDVNMLDNSDVGDAQQALRAIIQDRSRSTSAHEGSVGSQHSLQFTSSPPVQQHQFSQFNASPTTITDPDLATPSTDRESFSSNGSTRCVCNSSEPSTLMTQCNSCGKWLHTMCIGIDSRYVSDLYVCIYCSQTPMRNNRVRDPRRSSMPISASPLAHKSSRLGPR